MPLPRTHYSYSVIFDLTDVNRAALQSLKDQLDILDLAMLADRLVSTGHMTVDDVKEMIRNVAEGVLHGK